MQAGRSGRRTWVWRAGWQAACWLRHVAEVSDREVLSRLGPRGMMVVTLLGVALVQALLPRWSGLGGAPLPLIWGAVGYFMLRLRRALSLEAAVAGAGLTWLATPGGNGRLAVAFLVVALACAVWRGRFYAEFWPAHAFFGFLLAAGVPVVAYVIGASSPVGPLSGYLATLVTGPLSGVVAFGVLDRARVRLGIELEFPGEEEPGYDPAYVYRPFAASGPGF